MPDILGLNSGPIESTAIPLWVPDRLLHGANGGVMGLFDLSYAPCFAGAETDRAPLAGEAIKDIAKMLIDGSQSATTFNGAVDMDFEGGLPSYAGNGFDYSTATIIGSTVSIPNIAEHVTAQTNQYWYQCLYGRFPTKAEWITGGGIRPISAYTTHASGFQAEPDLLTIAMVTSGGVPFFRAVRTTSAGVYEQLQFTPYDAHFYDPLHSSNIFQALWWRDASGVGFQLRTDAGGIQSVTGAVGVKTTQNLAGKKWRSGLGRSFWPGAPSAAARFRLHRGWTEDTELSGRDARTEADQDWKRVMARPAHVAFS